MNIHGKSVIALVILSLVTISLGCSFLNDTGVSIAPSIQPEATFTQVPVASPSQTQDQISLPATITDTPDFFSKAYSLSDNDYVIPLTIKHVTDGSATLFFELRNPQTGLLVYRSSSPDVSLHGEVPITGEETRHMITIDGLSPGVGYQAMVLVDHGGDLRHPTFAEKEWGMVSFETIPDQGSFRVGVLGDASFGDEATYSLIDLMSSQNLDFVVHTGDVVYETDNADLQNSYLLKFFEPFSALLHQAPVYTVLGNHDYDATLSWNGAPFYDYAFPPFPDTTFSYPESRRANQYYAFAYRDIQFLILDSQVLFGVEGRAEQDEWLEERLIDPKYRFTIPIFHVAPYSSSLVHQEDSLPVRYSWVPLFEAAKVPVSFSGHFHAYERISVNDITYIVTGGGSSTLYAQGDLLPESRIYAPITHFVLMEIFTDNIQISAITKDGELIDQATIPLE